MIQIEIERDWVKIAGQIVYRPENIVPGDWMSFWDAAVSPVDYQEAYDEGVNDTEKRVAKAEEEAYKEGYEAAKQEAVQAIELLS